VITLCVIILIAAEPQITLFVIFFLYAFSGPVLASLRKLVSLWKKAREKKASDVKV